MTLADLQPVNQDSTAAIIARQLRAAIMSGALLPGAQLGEADLAARFQVSRGPLREAMQRLVQEGLLRSERNRGLFVIELEPADVFDIYVARNAIEQSAARLILRANRGGIVADQLAPIHAELAAAITAGDPAAVGDADGRFHEEFVRASGSKRLTRMAGTLLVESRMCIVALQRTYQPEEDQLAEHGALVDGLRAGNEIALLKLIESHMEDAVVRLVPGHSLNGAGPVRTALAEEPIVPAAAPATKSPRRRKATAKRTR
ncbi:MAG TPA: GntR family transcriptional regulator [Pseudonocardiaceae bacterium]|jgi:DNA-binding GntR family transcriptional regulator|nr:GntR family transcriptional regulator [Pseudonocardiaceae bacterium]